MIYDAMAFAGIALLCAGVWAQWGWPFAAIVAGLLIIAAAVKGALNDPTKDIESKDDAG